MEKQENSLDTWLIIIYLAFGCMGLESNQNHLWL